MTTSSNLSLLSSPLYPFYTTTSLPLYLNSSSSSSSSPSSSSSSLPPCPVSPSLYLPTLIPTLYGLICILGTVGNTLAVCVLAQGGGGRRTVANTFMLNLCVSDLLFLLSLPLWAVYYSLGYHWPFGRLACKICGGLVSLNLYASIFFITCMSMDRYLAIVHPLRSQSARNPRRARLTCALVWLLACAVSAPTLVMRDTHKVVEWGVEACVILYSHHGWFLGLAWMKILLGFLLPMTVISSCYCAIARHLLGGSGSGSGSGLGAKRRSLEPSDRPLNPSSKPQEPSLVNPSCKPDPLPRTSLPSPNPSGGSALEGRGLEGRGLERVLWTVAAVVLAFFLCWFPFHCVTLLDVLLSLGWVEGCWPQWAVSTLLPLTLCLGFSNSAINPVLYCFLGNHFRDRLGGLWKGQCVCVKASEEGQSQKRGSFSTRLSSISRKLSDLKELGPLEVPGLA